MSVLGTVNPTKQTGYYPASTPPPQIESPSKIRDQITVLESGCINLDNTISDLVVRLNTVLTPMPPDTAQAGQSVPTPPSSDVYHRLVTLNDALTRINNWVLAIAARVEV